MKRAVERAEECYAADVARKTGKEVRSALADRLAVQEAAKVRARMKQVNMPAHLRTGTNPLDMGCKIEYTTQQARSQTLPIQMAVDPKWSTDLKKTNDKVGQRIEYERKISAAITGSISPELPFMPPKKHISNPPTPYFEPGKLPRHYVHRNQ